MSHTSRIFFPLVLIMTCGVSPSQAILITYTGNAFTTTPPSPGPGNVTASFDFNTTLIDGQVYSLSDVSSWSMSAAGRAITNATASFSVAEFTIGSSLLPVAWAFSAEADLEAGPSPETIFSISGSNSVFTFSGDLDLVGLDDSLQDDPEAMGTNSFVDGSAGSTAGTWTAVPEPSAFLCLGSAGLAVVGWRRLKSRRRTM